MKSKFDILLIEDSSSDAKLIELYLADAYEFDSFRLTKADSLTAGLDFLDCESFSVILLDLFLPESFGIATFQKVIDAAGTTPVIVLSAYIDEDLGLHLMKRGAQDYLIKGTVKGKELRRSINYSIGRNELIKELNEKTKKLEERTDDLEREKTKLSQAQKLAQIGSWEWNIHDNVFLWSDELYVIHGLNPGEFDGTPLSYLEYVHIEDREYTKRIIESSFKTHTPFNFYYRIVSPDKGTRMIHTVGKVTAYKKGEPSLLFGTAQDVTERMHGEELEQLANAATQSFNSVVIANNEGKIEWVNEGFTRLSGYKLEDLKDDEKPFFQILNDSAFQNDRRSGKRTFGRTPFSYERECLSKSGKKYWVISTVTPVLDKNGEVERILIIDTDITHRKHIEEELVRTNNIKEQFLTNMSHEIRTPMNAIVGFTDLLLKTELTADQKQCIDAVKTSGRNLIVIINDILDFSKIEAGKITFEQIEFDLRHLISTLTELMLPKSMEKNIRISTKIDPAINSLLIGDPTRLNQIFLNLVGNAIKFTEKGEVKIIADLISQDKDSIELRFSVTDTGIGIAKDKLDKVFEGFTQAANDTNRKYGGTGLGLTIVKQLIELQGGSITVKSKLRKGSSFIFDFKFKKKLTTGVTNGKSKTKEKELAHIDKLNILLVEDNLMNQILARKVLTNWKWSVEVADNGLIALQKMKESSYDLVLMDIQMPEMDGYEATRAIRKNRDPEKRNIPIIAITAHAISGEAEKCYNAGMNDYLTKPFDERVLYKKIIEACSKNTFLITDQKNNFNNYEKQY